MLDMAKRKNKSKRPAATGNPWPKRLRALRIAIGEREGLGRSLLQSEAAERIGVSRRTWIAWETGQQIPRDAYQRLIPLTFGRI